MTSAIALPAPSSASSGSAAGAAALSIIGSIVALLVAGLGLLTAPVAAVIVFGPTLWELL